MKPQQTRRGWSMLCAFAFELNLGRGETPTKWRQYSALASSLWARWDLQTLIAESGTAARLGGNIVGSTTGNTRASSSSSRDGGTKYTGTDGVGQPHNRRAASPAGSINLDSRAAPASSTLGRHRELSAAGEPPGPGLMALLGAMAGVFRGLGSTSLGHATFGLQALARRHEEQRLVDHPPGRPLPAGAATQAEAERLLDALELAHGAYRRSAAALAATTCLRAQHIRMWRPEAGRLQPGYYVAVDHPGRRVVWGVRGTRAFADLLTDLAMAAHPLGVGEAHWGMTHAANWLLQQEAQRIGALLRSLRPAGRYRLELVGHSLGGAVAALVAVMLREGLVEAARSSAIPAELVTCIAFAPPAAVSTTLAVQCRPYVTSVVLNNDLVPRFNASSLAMLQAELQSVDWFAELQRTLMEHTMMKSLSSTIEAFTPSPAAQAGAEQPGQPSAPSGGFASPFAPALAVLPLQPPIPAGAATVVQQMSAAVLQSAAFKAAVQALDEWKARTAAAAEDQADAARKRQIELIRPWLQDVAAANLARHAETRSALEGRAAAGSAAAAAGSQAGEGTGELWSHQYSMDEIRRAAEAAAERLRQNVESAVSSVTAAATASRDRFSASLPSLPSLPQPHELPLVEPAASAAAAAAAAVAAVTASEQRFATRSAQDASIAGGAATSAAARPLEQAAGDAASLSEGPPDQAALELPLLLPPGRILYIRPLSDRTPTQVADAGTAIAPLLGRRRGESEDAKQCYLLTELPPGEGFRRVVLGRTAVEEHQCRAYRRVLMQMALQLLK